MGSQPEAMPGTAEREIVSNRVLDVSPAEAFAAFRDPELLARWWGPAGFTNTFQVFDFRPGGTWEFIMHGPDGADYPNKNVFLEIVEPERIVFEHVFPPVFQMTITFERLAQAGKTRFGFRMLFESAEVCEKLRGICVPANEQNFDRLEALLSKC